MLGLAEIGDVSLALAGAVYDVLLNNNTSVERPN